jgi:3-dehydroquinate synthetase
MAHDKKAAHGALNLVLAHGVGRAFLARDAAAGDVSALLQEQLSAQPGR